MNVDLFKQNGFDDEQFVVLPRLSSWAVQPGLEDKEEMTLLKKREIGLKVKRLLDYGRLVYIEQKLGLRVKVHQYCDPILESPECMLIAGIRESCIYDVPN